ncbi:dTDP-glucose 4,6-dehydratase [Arcticibacter svalbardensis MN12-7]|uniref:dTDP-glucose 4,6-dehydratase n=1 Tax=Arcticibacter svalbardensis MN12-7 TaxID=1150600 RepID=R9GM78_9SPHI|nr:NAD-dependent epimerase/dehydratase family protein [Arcticibacter svalbardensis]EOR92833.1 dTDP-glucose 4,6-dehydratase [Arcticibacter svalbardensis MN12-7]
MEHILVTGGAGFIGSNLIASLLQSKKYKITCIDNFDDFYSIEQKEWNIKPFLPNPDFSFIQGDIRNAEDLNLAKEVDIIIHLAAKAGVRPSIQNPSLYLDVNTNGTQVLLEYAHANDIKRFIFASSSSVYGINEHSPWIEEDTLCPISPYASSKIAGEMLGHVYSHLYGIRFLALRFFTVYGPGQRPDLAIHKFFKAISEENAIPVYGDGTTSRDYTFVGDAVKGIVAALDYERSNFEIVNIGNHNVITLRKLITAIEAICGKTAIIDRYLEQPGDVSKTFADISKAQEYLGYDPSTSLEEGLLSFYDWFKMYYAVKAHETLRIN